jgi:hypothetical protein
MDYAVRVATGTLVQSPRLGIFSENKRLAKRNCLRALDRGDVDAVRPGVGVGHRRARGIRSRVLTTRQNRSAPPGARMATAIDVI